MDVPPCEYTEKIEWCTLNEWIAWYDNYISIMLLKKNQCVFSLMMKKNYANLQVVKNILIIVCLTQKTY